MFVFRNFAKAPKNRKHLCEGIRFTHLLSDIIIICLSVMELGHLLTRSGLTYLEVSSEVCNDSFCQLGTVFHYPG